MCPGFFKIPFARVVLDEIHELSLLLQHSINAASIPHFQGIKKFPVRGLV
jgi:hypothetical protein